ncbi:MAG: DUF5335 domain-containing protein [Acidobacteria bacterium]|nr:DUF5335 domain-containing protein [Acidobacteriota bacterium]
MKKTIPRSDWNRFLKSFSLQHEGWLVDVESVSKGTSRSEARSIPLESVRAREDGSAGSIVVTAGESDDEPTRIAIDHPESLRVELNDGIEAGLEIEAASGTVTRICFVSPVAPESVDGLVI